MVRARVGLGILRNCPLLNISQCSPGCLYWLGLRWPARPIWFPCLVRSTMRPWQSRRSKSEWRSSTPRTIVSNFGSGAELGVLNETNTLRYTWTEVDVTMWLTNVNTGILNETQMMSAVSSGCSAGVEADRAEGQPGKAHPEYQGMRYMFTQWVRCGGRRTRLCPGRRGQRERP